MQVPTSQPISFEDFIGRLGEASGRLTQGANQNLLGFTGGGIGAGSSASRALSAPRFDVSQLFAALQPFEEQQMNEAVAGVRGSFGSAGGRFSQQLLNQEGRTRADVGNQQALRRQELARGSFEDAENRRIQALGQILPMLIQQSSVGGGQANDLLRTILGFGAPGAAQQDPGILPGLLGAGANIAGVGLLPGGFLR